jgi:protein MAK11
VQLGDEEDIQLLAVSTEDGRILFYSTRPADLVTSATAQGKEAPLASAKLFAQLGGKEAGRSGRIKDFSILSNGECLTRDFIVVTGGSDGALRIWKLAAAEVASHEGKAKQVGELLGTYETNNRVTCLKSFVMLPKMEGAEDDEIDDFEGFEDGEEESSADSD